MKKVIYCPVCHQRLFDADTMTNGEIEIKCPRCRGIQHILLSEPEQGKAGSDKWEKWLPSNGT